MGADRAVSKAPPGLRKIVSPGRENLEDWKRAMQAWLWGGQFIDFVTETHRRRLPGTRRQAGCAYQFGAQTVIGWRKRPTSCHPTAGCLSSPVGAPMPRPVGVLRNSSSILIRRLCSVGNFPSAITVAIRRSREAIVVRCLSRDDTKARSEEIREAGGG